MYIAVPNWTSKAENAVNRGLKLRGFGGSQNCEVINYHQLPIVDFVAKLGAPTAGHLGNSKATKIWPF